MKKLERDSLSADRDAVKAMLASIDPTDPVGRMSFESRLAEIELRLRELEEGEEKIGQVALMFAGDPVLGSRSISAQFASTAISTFQDLVTKTIAREELGKLGARGKIPLKTATTLGLTDLVRGSVGFILEEQVETEPLVDTAVKKAIDDITDVIARTASENPYDFEDAVERLDQRLLVSLRQFFKTLDEGNASVRIVEDERDAVLDINAVRRGRSRVDETEITETENETIVGELLGILPDSKRFEMRLGSTGEVIKGTVAADYAKRYLALIEGPNADIVGRHWRVKMKIREIRERNKAPRNLYTLIGLLQQVNPPR